MIPNIASGCFLEIRTFSYFDLVVFQHEKWTLHSAFKLNGLKLHAVPILVALFYSPKAVQWCLHTFWWINCALAQCRFCKGAENGQKRSGVAQGGGSGWVCGIRQPCSQACRGGSQFPFSAWNIMRYGSLFRLKPSNIQLFSQSHVYAGRTCEFGEYVFEE